MSNITAYMLHVPTFRSKLPYDAFDLEKSDQGSIINTKGQTTKLANGKLD